ncbi:hypothetical protein D3C86_1938060 [compost metagenome]
MQLSSQVQQALTYIGSIELELIYPVTDCFLETGSREIFKDGPLLDAKSGAQAWGLTELHSV